MYTSNSYMIPTILYLILNAFIMAAGSQSSGSELGGSVADQAANMVTIISPEGTPNFSLLSGSDSTSQASSNPVCAPPTDPQSSGNDGPTSSLNRVGKVEVTASKLAGEPVAAEDDQGPSESSCTSKLERLSVSAGMDTDSKASSKVVPALFVFGGMDTQETVHGDAFIFVPY